MLPLYLAWKVERKNVSPVAGGKKIKSQGRTRGECGIRLMRVGGE